MSNLFDSSNYATTEPSALKIGDFWAWKRTDLDTDYGTGYTWTYYAVLEADASTKITITSTLTANEYVIEVASATTATYTAGVYHWTGYIIKDATSERIALDTGTFKLLENTELTQTDPRSHVKIVLDALEAMIAGKATKDQRSYTIGDRSIERLSPTELLTWYKEYKTYYQQELNAERIANGESGAGTIRVRLY